MTQVACKNKDTGESYWIYVNGKSYSFDGIVWFKSASMARESQPEQYRRAVDMQSSRDAFLKEIA